MVRYAQPTVTMTMMPRTISSRMEKERVIASPRAIGQYSVPGEVISAGCKLHVGDIQGWQDAAIPARARLRRGLVAT
jgi:hypothetical protein